MKCEKSTLNISFSLTLFVIYIILHYLHLNKIYKYVNIYAYTHIHTTLERLKIRNTLPIL